MIVVSDILASFNKKLKENFDLPIYGKNTKEGYDLPCFYTQLIINNYNPYNANFFESSISIICAYLTEIVDQVEQYEMIEKFQKLFYKYLKVNDRYLHIESVSQTYTGENNDIIQFNISISYYDNLTDGEIKDPIKEIDLKINKGD